MVHYKVFKPRPCFTLYYICIILFNQHEVDISSHEITYSYSVQTPTSLGSKF